jgi:hypothetical protein
VWAPPRQCLDGAADQLVDDVRRGEQLVDEPGALPGVVGKRLDVPVVPAAGGSGPYRYVETGQKTGNVVITVG